MRKKRIQLNWLDLLVFANLPQLFIRINLILTQETHHLPASTQLVCSVLSNHPTSFTNVMWERLVESILAKTC